MTATSPATSAPPAPGQGAAPRRGFGPLLLRLHFYAGLVVAPFVLLAALTGLAYAFTPQIERVVHAEQLVVAPGDAPRALSEQVAAARAAHPEGSLAAVRPGSGDTTTQVDFTAPGLDDEHKHTVYVNQYTATVTGQLTTWWAATPVRTWFDDMHTNLNLGPIGLYYSEFAASWLWVVALGGVALWWRRQRGRRSARTLLAPDLAAKKGVRRTRSWHASLGLWLSVGLLFLSATGLTWSEYAGANFGKLVDGLHGSRPAVSTALAAPAAAPAAGEHAEHGGGAPAVSPAVDPAVIDKVLQTATANGIGGRLTVTPPAEAGAAWTVTEEDARWPVGRDSIAVDGTTGEISDRIDFADWPVLAKLTQWGIYAHMGDLFGLANQLVLAALALGLITVIVWGYRMWWQRRPTRADRRALAGAPPARGAWQQLPSWGIVLGVPVVFAIGWFMPLFGVPLAGFLLIDVLVGALRRRRRPVPVSPAPAGS
ncbi:PepSY-associated TM helix domain-containing protein [Actinoplanes sp. RD1]|uniref:PepSY-associated TM helix domain-containing protein n=1 Tax=Actinoplanes sp. RD1 TaxID=3064538 RepID=UPI00274266A3|nr:PepSY domain-containing protein [Actinoplanes sp. RD1]